MKLSLPSLFLAATAMVMVPLATVEAQAPPQTGIGDPGSGIRDQGSGIRG
jgi:hypothetical protein